MFNKHIGGNDTDNNESSISFSRTFCTSFNALDRVNRATSRADKITRLKLIVQAV